MTCRETIDKNLRQISELDAQKKKVWDEIKDFKVDAVRADKGYSFMTKLTKQINKLQLGIHAEERKIKKIEKDEQD